MLFYYGYDILKLVYYKEGFTLDIRVLRYFLALTTEESISGAAEVLHTTQPNLSRQLAELENEVGKQLFLRGSRKITLTEAGLFLRKRAQEIIDLVDKTQSDFSSFDEITGGDVYIGAGETKAMRVIAQTVKNMQADYPHVQYHLYSGNAYDVTEQLDKGLVDFGILIEPIDLSKYDHIQLPCTDIWGILMRKDDPLASKSTIHPEDLKNVPILCSRQMLNENGLSGWLGYDSKKLHIITTFNLIHNPALFVEEGIGYAFSFEDLLNVSGDCNLCFKPLEPRLTSNLYIVWKKYQIFSKAANKFLAYLQEEINNYTNEI